MAKKDLKYFMRSMEEEIVTAPGPSSFKDDDGNVIQFEIKKLTQEEINRINDNYRERSIAVDRKGNPLVANGEVIWKVKKDNARATRHMLAEALVYPNIKDPKLMEYYKCNDISEMALKVFRNADEYQHVLRIVMKALGLSDEVDDKDKEDLEAAKNL